MIGLGLLCIVLYVFLRHPLFWMLGVALLGLGLLLIVLNATGHAVVGTGYGW
jgi:hypothetical protein